MKNAAQEERITDRRNQILAAAATVFAAQGFHPTTIKAVARAAGVADGTIYIYFPNKSALLIGILDRMTETAQADVDFPQLAEGDLRNWLRAYFRQPLIAFKADNFALFRVIISEIMVNQDLRDLYRQKILEPMIALAETSLQQWADRNSIKPIDIHLTMRALSSVVFGLVVQRIIGDQTLEAQWDELPDFLADLVLDGMRSEHV